MKIDDGMQPAKLRIQLTHPQGGREDRGISSEVRIFDEVSGFTIAEIELTRDDFFNLMAGRIVGPNQGPSRVITADIAQHVGKEKIRIRRNLGRIGYRNRDERIAEWAEQAARAMGAHDSYWNVTSGGVAYVEVIFYGNRDAGYHDAWEVAQRRILNGFSTSALEAE